MNSFTLVRYLSCEELEVVSSIVDNILSKEKNLYYAVRAYSSVHYVSILTAFQYLIYVRFKSVYGGIVEKYKKELEKNGFESIDFVLEGFLLGLKIKTLEETETPG